MFAGISVNLQDKVYAMPAYCFRCAGGVAMELQDKINVFISNFKTKWQKSVPRVSHSRA